MYNEEERLVGGADEDILLKRLSGGTLPGKGKEFRIRGEEDREEESEVVESSRNVRRNSGGIASVNVVSIR